MQIFCLIIEKKNGKNSCLLLFGMYCGCSFENSESQNKCKFIIDFQVSTLVDRVINPKCRCFEEFRCIIYKNVCVYDYDDVEVFVWIL